MIDKKLVYKIYKQLIQLSIIKQIPNRKISRRHFSKEDTQASLVVQQLRIRLATWGPPV